MHVERQTSKVGKVQTDFCKTESKDVLKIIIIGVDTGITAFALIYYDSSNVKIWGTLRITELRTLKAHNSQKVGSHEFMLMSNR